MDNIAEFSMIVEHNGTRLITRRNNVRSYRIIEDGECFIIKGGNVAESASNWNYVCDYRTMAGATAHVLEILGWQ